MLSFSAARSWSSYLRDMTAQQGPLKVAKEDVSQLGIQYENVTVDRVSSEIQPALNEMVGMNFPGRVSIALSRNFKYLEIVTKQMDKEMSEKLKQHAELDEHGNVKTNKPEPGKQPTVVFKSKEDEEAYTKWWREVFSKKEYPMMVHKIRINDIENLPMVKPIHLHSLNYLIHDPSIPATE